MIDLLGSGVPELDTVLGGGVPKGDVLLVIGPAGSGKTSLTFQIAFHQVRAGRNVVYVSTLSEPPLKLLKHIGSYSFFDERFIGKNLVLLNVYPLVKQGLARVLEALLAAVKEHKASLLVIDGLMTIRDVHPETREVRQFIYELAGGLAVHDCTSVVTTSGSPDLDPGLSPELTMADGIVTLGQVDRGPVTLRTIRVQKVRGLAPLLGLHGLTIGDDGLSISPRIESFVRDGEVGLSDERVTTGAEELDLLMGGGIPAGSSTVLAGAPGTGTTIMGLQFVVAGALRGDKGVIVGFREGARQLADKARRLGMDLDKLVADGRIAIVHRAPSNLLPDEVLAETWAAVRRLGARRLFMDGVGELQHAILDPVRERSVLSSLVELLRSKGCTALFVRKTSQSVGPELDFSDSPLALLAENLVFLRYVDFRGDLHRIISVLKMRESAHDHSIREYVITRDRVQVLTREQTKEGVLAAIGRLPSELRVKRPSARGLGEGGA